MNDMLIDQLKCKSICIWDCQTAVSSLQFDFIVLILMSHLVCHFPVKTLSQIEYEVMTKNLTWFSIPDIFEVQVVKINSIHINIPLKYLHNPEQC